MHRQKLTVHPPFSLVHLQTLLNPGNIVVKTIVKGLFLILALSTTQLASAQAFSVSESGVTKVALPDTTTPAITPLLKMVQDSAKWPVKPSQAALIAQDAYPGSIVLGVRLLPSGEYAVTLKTGGSVQKVLVDATSGRLG